MKAATADLDSMMSRLQMENGILLPTLQSALPFLDLHGTPRLEFHQSVFDELRENLMERVAVIAEGKEADRWVAADFEFRLFFFCGRNNSGVDFCVKQIFQTGRAAGEELSSG